MYKYLIKQVSPMMCKDHLLDEIGELKEKYIMNGGTDNCKIYMSWLTYQELKREIDELDRVFAYHTDIHYNYDKFGIVFGLPIQIDNSLNMYQFVIKEEDKMFKYDDSIDTFGYAIRSYGKSNKVLTPLPTKYVINNGATILFWSDGTKTIVKRSEEDEYNKILSFLWAYFQKHSGLSKTKANEYLKGLVDDKDLKVIEMLENGNLMKSFSDVANEIGNAFKSIANSFNKEN